MQRKHPDEKALKDLTKLVMHTGETMIRIEQMEFGTLRLRKTHAVLDRNHLVVPTADNAGSRGC